MQERLSRAPIWLALSFITVLFALLSYQYLIHWDIGYSSDTALIGLMAKKIAEIGERPIYVWSVGYQGVFIEAYLTALFYKFFGVNPVVATVVPCISFSLGLFVWCCVVKQAFGWSVALLTALLTVVSCPFLYHLNTRTLPNFAEAFLIGSLFLWVYASALKKVTAPKILLLGFLMGFGAYTFLISGYYFLAVFFHLVFVAYCKEPNRVSFFLPHRFLSGYGRKTLGAFVVLAWINFGFGLATFLFSWKEAHWGPYAIKWDPLMHIVGTILFLGVTNALILLPAYLKRFPFLKWVGPALLAGFLVGYSPAIYYKNYLHGKGGKGIAIRGTLETVWKKFGYFVHTHDQIFNAHQVMGLSAAAIFICLAGIGIFIWKTGSFFRQEHQREHFDLISPLFLFPWIILTIFLTTSMVGDVHSGRYLGFLVSFYALAIAWTFVFLWRKCSSSLVRGILAVLLGLVLLNNSYALIKDVHSAGVRTGLDSIVGTLDSHNLKYGYADYWAAYAINLYTNERIILEPTLSNYSPHYGPLVRKQLRLAYLVNPRDRLNPDAKEVSLYGNLYRVEKNLGVHGGFEIYVLNSR